MAVRIGILGGSFNPVHVGHLTVAEGACDALGLEKVLLVPANVPPHKDASELAPAADRLKMVRLAVENNPHLEASELELRRPAPSYTIDTIRALQEELGTDAQILFIIGADSVVELPGWHRIGELIHMCTVVPAARPGISLEDVPGLAESIGEVEAHALCDRLIRIPLVDVSATEIRERVRAGRSIRYLVPEGVRQHILAQRLYVPACH